MYICKIKQEIMITAKELFDKMLEENDECTSTEMMIEFAKMHVEKALEEASDFAIGCGDEELADNILEIYQILNNYERRMPKL